MLLKKKSFILIFLLLGINLVGADEKKTNQHQLNFFTGNFDFSDDKQKALLLGHLF